MASVGMQRLAILFSVVRCLLLAKAVQGGLTAVVAPAEMVSFPLVAPCDRNMPMTSAVRDLRGRDNWTVFHGGMSVNSTMVNQPTRLLRQEDDPANVVATETCPVGFSGPGCLPCVRDAFTGECDTRCHIQGCNFHGRCTGSGSCRCFDGWSGPKYETRVGPTGCPLGFGGSECQPCSENVLQDGCDTMCTMKTCGNHGMGRKMHLFQRLAW